jgi:4-amino-4-deoxy-L-arabinose transferase-like glycosyltransferase
MRVRTTLLREIRRPRSAQGTRRALERPRTWIAHGAILALVLGFFAQLTFGSTALSLTSDEPPHIAHGYLLLTTGDTWALGEHRHPPLLNMLSALPLLLQPERPVVTAVPGWRTDFVVFVRAMWPLLGPVERQAYVARVPTMLLAVLLMALVARWARRSSGRLGALLAVSVMAFDPTMVAHSQLATTDVGTALFTFAAVCLATRPRSGLMGALCVGAATGAAMASKGSAAMVLPVALALQTYHTVAASWTRGAAERRRGLQRSAALALVACLTATAVLWASYGFRLDPPTGGLRLPLAAHVRMVRLILGEKARTAFLMGEVRQGGWAWYFPFAFVVKTPLPFLVLLGVAVLLPTSHRWKLLRHPALWLYPLSHLGTSVASGMNIGLRHLLPIYPFLYIAIGGLARAKLPCRVRSAHLWGPAIGLLVGWQAMEAAAVFPFGIAYFNQLVGGPKNGYRVLVDSNVDWGQSFMELSAYMQDAGVDSVRLSYYTWIDPAAYGVAYQPLPPAGDPAATLEHPYDPAPGIYAISATPLQGVMVSEEGLYGWFRQREPDAQPGYGLLVYHVDERPVSPTWLAQCTQPAMPLPHEAIVAGFGRADLRQIAFDCTQGWILPSGGREAGWYVVHDAASTTGFVDTMVARSGASLSYKQRQPGRLPPFSIALQPAGVPAPDTSLPQAVRFGAISLIGYKLEAPSAKQGETVEIATWWRVEAAPGRPLSLMLHLGSPDAPPIAVGDGLAVPVDTWQTGDILIQRHTLEVPTNTVPDDYAVVAGAYWLDTLERLPVADGAEVGATSARLATVEIRRP